MATPDDFPLRVLTASRMAAALNFGSSCSAETGSLLRTLASIRPDGRVAESGTGTGFGAAWLLEGLGTQGRLVTVEHDPNRAMTSAAMFSDDERVSVLAGDWRLLDAYAPFDLFFCDGGGKREDPDHVIDLLAPGGILVLDDFTPSDVWPPAFEGHPDELRLRYLADARLQACDVRVSTTESVIVAVRRHD